MYLYFSKMLRMTQNIKTPNCYAFMYLPESLKTICDCKNTCKYDPNGGSNIPIFQNNNYIVEQRHNIRL